ncbi:MULTISPECIES: ATP-binding protein [unclassified Streptomyces]|uniref:ATP-binding protein n=1 Tax=unclassified Streptomyces TaxID=2593676 RepID=UPI00211D0E12|nr:MULTISPECIES: hypothetical protein [unclassified Streptomyces]
MATFTHSPCGPLNVDFCRSSSDCHRGRTTGAAPHGSCPQAPHRPAQLAHDFSLFAPADATAPQVCRDFVRAVLRTLDRAPLVLPAILCTSELVTNVHLHTKGTTMLRVQLTPARLRVGVYDETPPRTPEDTEPWGDEDDLGETITGPKRS